MTESTESSELAAAYRASDQRRRVQPPASAATGSRAGRPHAVRRPRARGRDRGGLPGGAAGHRRPRRRHRHGRRARPGRWCPSSAATSTTWSAGTASSSRRIQELTRLAVLTATGQRSRLMLDIGGYRAGRRAVLTELGPDHRRAGPGHRRAGPAGADEPVRAQDRARRRGGGRPAQRVRGRGAAALRRRAARLTAAIGDRPVSAAPVSRETAVAALFGIGSTGCTGYADAAGHRRRRAAGWSGPARRTGSGSGTC